jgi:hypothetical protein
MLDKFRNKNEYNHDLTSFRSVVFNSCYFIDIYKSTIGNLLRKTDMDSGDVIHLSNLFTNSIVWSSSELNYGSIILGSCDLSQ